MGFWSGFEGLTGHQPGAFKGFSLKDIIDDDLWKRHERLGGRQSRQFEETGVVPTTAWYRGRGRPEMMGPRVGAAGVTPVNPASRVPFTRRQGGFTGPRPTREYPIVPSDRISHDYARTSPARPWANLQPENLLTPSWAGSAASADRDVGMGANRFLQLGDPRNIRSGPDLPPASGFRSPATGMLPAVGRDRPFPVARRPDIASQAEQDRLRAINSGNPAALRAAGITPAMGDINREPRWIDKTTTVKESAAVDVPNTTTTVYKEKVQPASIMNMRIPTSELAGGRDEDRMREMFRILQGMRARRGY